MKDFFCIVGAGDMKGTKLYIPKGAFIIAADGGLAHLKSAGVEPNLIMGDFDSLGRTPTGKNVLRHAPEKDDTDTMLAVKKSLELGAKTLLIYGGLGGRFDHSIANLQTLAYIAAAGARGYLIGCGSVCTAFKNGGLAFGSGMKGIISVFCLGSEARGVDLKGLKYPLSNHTLYCDVPLGTSNEFLGEPASVSVREGILAVIWSGNSFETKKYYPF